MAPDRAEADSPPAHPLSQLQAVAAHVCSEAGDRWNNLLGCADVQRQVAQKQASRLLDSLVRAVRRPPGAEQGRARPVPALAVRVFLVTAAPLLLLRQECFLMLVFAKRCQRRTAVKGVWSG